MNKWKVGFKVLRKGRCSATSWGLSAGARRYSVGKRTEPLEECGPLCVFDSFDNAEMFKTGSSARKTTWKIVKCKYLPSTHDRVWDSCSQTTLRILPIGTRLASAVICTE